MTEKSRNKGLDILKIFCILFIILLHTQALKESFSINLVPICRFAVPCFFMITGFFYDDVVKRGNEVKQIKKILILILFINSVLILLNVISIIYSGDSVFEWIVSCFSKKNLFKLLVFNEDLINGHFGSDHIWYLNALLYVLVIAYVLRKINLFRIIYFLTLALLLCGLVLEFFSPQIFGARFGDGERYYLYRNFLTVGIPYFSIGSLLNHCKIEKLKKYNILMLFASVLLLGFSFVEFKIELFCGLSSSGEFFILTPVYSVGIFVFFHNLFEGKDLNILGKIAAFLGERYVVWVYLFHLPVMVLVEDILEVFGFLYPNKIIVSLLTLAFSLIVAAITDYALSLRKRKNCEITS